MHGHLVLLLAAAVTLVAGNCGSFYVSKYSVFERTLTASGSYADPYLEMPGDLTTPGFVTATFDGPGGIQLVVDGFWDGGNVWKVRMAPTVPGSWSWSTSSSDPGLDGRSGSFQVVEGSDPGFVERDPVHAWSWRWSGSQTPHFWLSDTCWRCFTRYTVGDFLVYVSTRKLQGFNHLRGHFNPMNGDVRDENEGGRPFLDSVLGDQLNPGYWQGVDARMAYASYLGVTMDLTVGSGSRWPTSTTDAQRTRYLRYLIARYAAYHLTWEGLSEYGEYSPDPVALINAIGQTLEALDPYQHPRSTHVNIDLDDVTVLAGESWMDWLMYQSIGPNDAVLVSHRSYGKPLNNEEFYYEQTCSGSSSHNSTSSQMRRGAWRIVVAGGGVATGNTATYTGGSNVYNSCGLTGKGVSQMKHLYDFWTGNGIPFSEMEPRNDLADNGATCRVKPDDTYVCYQKGAAFALDLSDATGTFSAWRFDPRTGASVSLGDVSGGAPTVLTPPDSEDWIFRVQRAP